MNKPKLTSNVAIAIDRRAYVPEGGDLSDYIRMLCYRSATDLAKQSELNQDSPRKRDDGSGSAFAPVPYL